MEAGGAGGGGGVCVCMHAHMCRCVQGHGESGVGILAAPVKVRRGTGRPEWAQNPQRLVHLFI